MKVYENLALASYKLNERPAQEIGMMKIFKVLKKIYLADYCNVS